MQRTKVQPLPTVLFLCGPHCSGKTTILRRLVDEGRIIRRGSEIGKDLYYERSLQTDAQDSNFEFEVATLEIARDRTFLGCDGIVGVETWHPGNLAYAAVRNPDSVSPLCDYVMQSPLIGAAFGIHFRLPAELIAERTQTFRDDPQWAASFYSAIDRHLDTLLGCVGLAQRTIEIDASRPFEIVMQEVLEYLSALRPSARPVG